MKNMAMETVTPETAISIQTVEDSGARKANRSTDFLGDLTYKMLIPESKEPLALPFYKATAGERESY